MLLFFKNKLIEGPQVFFALHLSYIDANVSNLGGSRTTSKKGKCQNRRSRLGAGTKRRHGVNQPRTARRLQEQEVCTVPGIAQPTSSCKEVIKTNQFKRAGTKSFQWKDVMCLSLRGTDSQAFGINLLMWGGGIKEGWKRKIQQPFNNPQHYKYAQPSGAVNFYNPAFRMEIASRFSPYKHWVFSTNHAVKLQRLQNQ